DATRRHATPRDATRRDAVLAVRALRRSPSFAAAAIAILGLGIGMSTAMFTVYRAAIVARLPVQAQDGLIAMNPRPRGGAHLDVPAKYLDDIRRNGGALSRRISSSCSARALRAAGSFAGRTGRRARSG
ncbi:MAG: hypothetical protein ACHQWU_11030, partial [Gemmatimonadales bacterium]